MLKAPALLNVFDHLLQGLVAPDNPPRFFLFQRDGSEPVFQAGDDLIRHQVGEEVVIGVVYADLLYYLIRRELPDVSDSSQKNLQFQGMDSRTRNDMMVVVLLAAEPRGPHRRFLSDDRVFRRALPDQDGFNRRNQFDHQRRNQAYG